MICDRCGVKITTTDARRSRCSHIELPVTIRHPLGDASDMLDAFPVLPAIYFESPAGARLADAYDALFTVCMRQDQIAIVEGPQRILELLVPVACEAHSWNLQEAEMLARGIALHPIRASATSARIRRFGHVASATLELVPEMKLARPTLTHSFSLEQATVERLCENQGCTFYGMDQALLSECCKAKFASDVMRHTLEFHVFALAVNRDDVVDGATPVAVVQQSRRGVAELDVLRSSTARSCNVLGATSRPRHDGHRFRVIGQRRPAP
jgi:hypothetical protein